MADQTKHVPVPSSLKSMASDSKLAQQKDRSLPSTQLEPKLGKDHAAKSAQKTLPAQSESSITKNQNSHWTLKLKNSIIKWLANWA